MLPSARIDETYLHQVFAAERPRLVRLCAQLVGDADAAEDLAQETLIEAWRHIDQLRDPQAISAWLSGIARNVSARWHRKHAQLTRTVERAGAATAAAALTADDDFAVDLERDELATLLDRALALLPAETRAVLVQSYIADSPHAEIAKQLGLSENAVAVRLHRGKLALRKLLATDLRQEAEQFDLIHTDDVWQETRIWCTQCGKHRLRGIFTSTEFALRCPACSIEPDAYYSQTNVYPYLEGIKGFRPALNRFSDWIGKYFRTAISHGEVACATCGRLTPLRLGIPDYAPPSVRARRGVHLRCTFCGAASYSAINGLALNLPEGRRFTRTHPRIHTLPEREIEHAGIPALLMRFETMDRTATLDVTMRRDTYAVLEVHEGDND